MHPTRTSEVLIRVEARGRVMPGVRLFSLKIEEVSMMAMVNSKITFMIGAWALICAGRTLGCVAPQPSTTAMVENAEVILRVTAMAEVQGGVEFRVEETLKGIDTPRVLVLKGYFIDEDDFNPRPVPYPMVRRGSGGMCSAYSYKPGAEYLLFLQMKDGELSPYWYSLAPVNEQLRSTDDAWVGWVRKYLQKPEQESDEGKDGATVSPFWLNREGGTVRRHNLTAG